MNTGPTDKVATSPGAAVPDYVLQLERAAHYLPPEQLPLLRRAWEVGASAHAGQTRKSGEPYITHPVAVAQVFVGRPAQVRETRVVQRGEDVFENQADIAGLVHEYVAYSLILLASLHGLAAVKHHFIDKDHTLKRMFGKKP